MKKQETEVLLTWGKEEDDMNTCAVFLGTLEVVGESAIDLSNELITNKKPFSMHTSLSGTRFDLESGARIILLPTVIEATNNVPEPFNEYFVNYHYDPMIMVKPVKVL